MPFFGETSTLRDVIVNADGSVKAAYNYTLSKDGEQIATDVRYTDYASGDTMTEEIYNLLQSAAQRPSN
jgi:hypothetical protein